MEFFPISKLLENHGLQLIVQDIFAYLDLDNLWNCREVSKSWRDFIDNNRVLLMLQLEKLKLQLEELKGTERHQKLLGTFQEWRDVFGLIEKSKLPKLQKCIGILKKNHTDRTSFKASVANARHNQGPHNNYISVLEDTYYYEEFTGLYKSR